MLGLCSCSLGETPGGGETCPKRVDCSLQCLGNARLKIWFQKWELKLKSKDCWDSIFDWIFVYPFWSTWSVRLVGNSQNLKWPKLESSKCYYRNRLSFWKILKFVLDGAKKYEKYVSSLFWCLKGWVKYLETDVELELSEKTLTFSWSLQILIRYSKY